MENLLLLLNKISKISPLGIFNQEVIIVQNAGMQHWLNLALAKERGISMNVHYALPAQYLWQLIRTLASDEMVPDQSPYAREVLTWRIYQLLASNTVINDEDFHPATRYWLVETDDDQSVGSNAQASLKRYQLAVQLGDLFEQYLIFRPDWLDSWQQGEFVLEKGRYSATMSEHKWQGKLWQLLTQELPYNPVTLLSDAIRNIGKKTHVLPKRLSFFGINTMAPMWLKFIDSLSEHIDVHFFHLNPCFDYWGDILSEKQAMIQLKRWSNELSEPECFLGNPLLANLGQQGREFLSIIQDYSTVNIDAFVEVGLGEQSSSKEQGAKALHQVQHDILALKDRRNTPITYAKGDLETDDSITITCCHSALREVQGLHDYLLHQFNCDPSLTPKDVLVMCPQIEQYAPFVNVVFTRGWQDIGDDVPPLPCSIADRSPLDSDPLISAFIELLGLPDSRFQVSQLLSFLRLPSIAAQFDINAESLDKITLWLAKASVHWGKDLTHKQSILGEQANNCFTWQQGLSRLLRGFAYADHECIYQDQLLLGHVEGDDAILLGQLMLFIEQLHCFSHTLNCARRVNEWQQFLLSQIEKLFDRTQAQSNEVSLQVIEQAIASLVEYCHQAHFDEKVDLCIVVDFLTKHFSQGDASQQFMVGQVTFCSMLPMRSIPFKVIAVLGLNDGEFPRQRQALGFDLMDLTQARLGDRSRRGDDRYLFLEAIISARQALYLSYQGRNIKNNNERQASLVLKELMEYLTQAYGWDFTLLTQTNEDGINQAKDTANKITNKLRQLPMQAFSQQNYVGKWPSFDANWLKLAKADISDKVVDPLIIEHHEHVAPVEMLSLHADSLIRFYQHPAKMFAQQQLNLYFDQSSEVLDDVEPFAIDHLQSYLLRQELLVNQLGEQNLVTSDDVLQRAHLTGKFPDSPITASVFSDYVADSEHFSGEIISQACHNPEIIDTEIEIILPSNSNSPLDKQSVKISAQLPVKHDQLVFYRCTTAKAKDLFTLYYNQLILQIWQEKHDVAVEHRLVCVSHSTGFYFNTKAQKVEQYCVNYIDDAEQKLADIVTLYLQGQQQALLLNGDLAAVAFAKKRGQVEEMTQEKFELFWYGNMSSLGFGEDPYIKYFWPICPQYAELQGAIETVYQGMYQSVQKTNKNNSLSSKGAKE